MSFPLSLFKNKWDLFSKTFSSSSRNMVITLKSFIIVINNLQLINTFYIYKFSYKMKLYS